MSGTWTAIRFLKASTMGPVWQGPTWETALELADQALRSDVYEPPGRPGGTIVFVHGMSPRATADERQVRACRVLAGLGFRVVSPRIPDLADTRVSRAALDHVGGAIAAVSTRVDLGGDRPVGVFSISYS